MMKPLLTIDDVHKDFRKKDQLIQILKGVSLQILPGESLAIIGPSGAGKSTLLNIMGTLEPPSKGRVFFNEKDVFQMDERGLNAIRNLEIGFVFQFHHLLFEFNAQENVSIPAMIAGQDKRESADRASIILEKMGLEDRIYHRIGELSGGEQQRVAIARALIMEPKLLLADEPTGNLDKATGDEIIKLLIELNNEKGLALIIVTHNIELADQLSKKLLLIDGKFV
jgi:lipoprotein-releasing system ATP-binding protein